MTLTETKRAEYARTLNDLIRAARLEGFVLSIDVVSLPVAQSKPVKCYAPEMGSYALIGEARLAKELYRGNP